MKTASKIGISIAFVVVFFVLFAVLVGIRQSVGSSTPGVFGCILLLGLIGALKVVWKKDNNS